MNKQGPGKIEWCDYTWNPITGCHGRCPYCFARRIYRRFKRSFEPTFHERRLGEPLKVENKRIFVSSTGDFFGKYVELIWRLEVYNFMKATPSNTFLILTKQPQNIRDDEVDIIPENAWIGVTVTEQRDLWKMKALENKYLDNNCRQRIFVSYEPAIGPIDVNLVDSAVTDWVIIGAMTGSKRTPLKREWIEKVVTWAGALGIPVFMKNSVKECWKTKLIRKFPEWANKN